MNDPLNPGPVTPLDRDPDRDNAAGDDKRGFWQRLLMSVRPSVSREKIIRTGKSVTDFELKARVDF
jgi:hypothetical protein